MPSIRQANDVETAVRSLDNRIDTLAAIQSRLEADLAAERVMVKNEFEHCVSESSVKIIQSHLDATARVINLIEESGSIFKKQLSTIKGLLEGVPRRSQSFPDVLEQRLRKLDDIVELVERNGRLEQALGVLHGEISASYSKPRQHTIFEMIHAAGTAAGITVGIANLVISRGRSRMARNFPYTISTGSVSGDVAASNGSQDMLPGLASYSFELCGHRSHTDLQQQLHANGSHSEASHLHHRLSAMLYYLNNRNMFPGGKRNFFLPAQGIHPDVLSTDGPLYLGHYISICPKTNMVGDCSEIYTYGD
jgi:hypothetical protein